MRRAATCKVLLASSLCLAASLEDDSALVQGRIAAHQAASSSAGIDAVEGHREVIQQLSTGQHPASSTKSFDCDKYPDFCQQPFNCQTFGSGEVASWFLRGMAADGKPNLRSWCSTPQYYNYVRTCLAGDLVEAGKIQYQWSLDQHNGVDELDGSYCFIEGHCSNAAVTNSTTMEEAIDMCDQRYGRDSWAKFGQLASMPKVMADLRDMPKDSWNGFHYSRQTTVFLKAACAMGNYHCDVMYCKETYCKNNHYIQKYAHLLPKAPGHLLQSKESLN